MNILQIICLAQLTASLTRIQISNADESWSNRAMRELINILLFVGGWWGAAAVEGWGWIPAWGVFG